MLEYQEDGSIIVTRDSDGTQMIVPPGKQAEQEAVFLAFVDPPQPVEQTLEEKVSALAALLVQKAVLTDKEVSDATAIDIAAVALPADAIQPGP